MVELNEGKISEKIEEAEGSITWLKNNWKRYMVSKNDIHTKDMIILKRSDRKMKLANLVNNYLEKICDEIKYFSLKKELIKQQLLFR